MNQLCDGNQPRGQGHINEWQINRNLGEEQDRTCFVFGVVISAWSAVRRVLWGPDWAWFALSEYVSLPPQWRWHAPRSRFTPDLWAASVKARHCSGLFRTYAHAHTCTHTTHSYLIFNLSLTSLKWSHVIRSRMIWMSRVEIWHYSDVLPIWCLTFTNCI